ncbi:MAG: sigma-54 dependent transcriptional regulator [Desulfuromonadaceae bacterium]
MHAHQEEILLVEDDASLRKLLEEELSDAGLQVKSCADARSALQVLERTPIALVVSDLRLPGEDGMWLLEQVQGRTPAPGFIIMTAFGTVTQAVEALKQGADDFITKPVDLDHLILCVQRNLETRRLRRDVQRFREVLGQEDFHGIIGHSRAMQDLFSMVRQISQSHAPVLISGESGTGKDMVARALHTESPRRDKKFVAVNCAAIPAELQESEFFGHAAGAFTGAGSARKGLFAEAEGGTLFLDEIGEMPLDLQAKLLRILQDGRVRMVGENTEIQLDVRVIAATNADLEQAVKVGTFREDLYFRLETFELHVPALRERGEDLELLAAYFIQRFNAQLGRSIQGLSPAALSLLRSYPFPGNVRELRNALERAFAFCTTSEIEAECLPQRIRHTKKGGSAQDDALLLALKGENDLPTFDELGNRYVAYVVEQVQGNKRRAAQILAISRATLYRRLEAAGVKV